jgi:Zn/Cd-binding protein ZinT
LATLTFFFQNAPITYFILFLNKSKKAKNQKKEKKKKKKKKKESKICSGVFWEKKVKVVELSQFESLGG